MSSRITETELLAEQMRLILQITDPEGSSVTICAVNADFDGPNNVITVSDDWTNWDERRFTGDSLLDCLHAAVAARTSANGKAPIPAATFAPGDWVTPILGGPAYQVIGDPETLQTDGLWLTAARHDAGGEIVKVKVDRASLRPATTDEIPGGKRPSEI